MASAGRIEAFHRLLEPRIHSLTTLHVVIRPARQDWKRVVKGLTISFDMVSRDRSTIAQRKRGGPCPVFPVNPQSEPFENQVWATWHEEWRSLQHGDFDLIGAGWTFFWGIDGRLGWEQQVLRAEWDQVPETKGQTHRRGGLAAQPHWHVDTDMMVRYSRPVSRGAPIAGPTELEELTPPSRPALQEKDSTGIQPLDVSGMHLGMGGWKNEDGHPGCWQMKVPENWAGLVDWAERTLQSARDQFQEVDVTTIVP